MICPDYLSEGLEVHFRRIQRERMQGIPLLNPALEVKAVGFRCWEGRCLGVLVTPWFMNLMLLPAEGDEWEELQIGTKLHQSLPSGDYEFTLGEEDGIGRYQSCSLFSPMFEFADQAAALGAAEAVMLALMQPENRDGAPVREDERVREEREEAGLSRRLEQPLSRRALLRGRLARDPGP